MTFDIVIKNAQIIDGTGQRRFKGNIGINKSKISTITEKELDGRQVIDCRGELVAAPGFIDMHSHSDLAMFMPQDTEFYKMGATCKISQGITTEIVGQDGFSAAPIAGDLKQEYTKHWKGLTGDLPVNEWTWNSVEEYLRAMKFSDFPTKIEMLVGHSSLRINIIGYDSRAPSSSELEDMQELLRTCLKQGAKGMSLGLIYPPGMFANEEELAALATVVAEEDGVLVAHIRNESNKVFEAINEYLRIQNTANVRTHISHLKICGNKNIGRGDELKKIILDSQKNVKPVSFDMYPYDAGSTMLQAILPPWAHEDGSEELIQRLKDKKTCLRMASDVLTEEEDDWDNFIQFSRGGMDGIVISGAPTSHKNIIGKSLSELGRTKGYDPTTKDGQVNTFLFICQLLVETDLGLSMVSFNQSMNNVEKFLTLNNIMTIGTDAVLGSSPHPRSYGAHAKYLKWIREQTSISLEQAIHNITGHAANIIRLDRGVLRIGASADITIFNPNKIEDQSTYKNPVVLATGIEHVLVDGRSVYPKKV
ncbi:MAG: amidohydrolase family protein [Promethearchaeota archaeon]